MLYTGNSWTTFPNSLPPNYDTSACSSVVYDESQLVIIGSSGSSKGGSSSSGIGLSFKEGRWQLQTTLPGLNMPIRTPLFTTITSLSKDSLSPASSTCLLDNRFLYAIVRNDTNDKIKKNVHGYTPQEELYVADVKEYIETQQKSLVSSVIGWVGSFVTGEKEELRPFWRPMAEMENSGASITGAATTTNDTFAVYAVGGFTTLSTKFYQVFAAKERVSCAARMLPLRRHQVTTTDKQARLSPTGGWVRLPDMNTRRKHLSTIVVGNYLYAIGGQDEQGKPLASVERLNLALCDGQDVGDVAWEPVAPLNMPRHSFAVTTTEEGVIVVAGGGGTAGFLNSVEYLEHTESNNHSPVWKQLPKLQTSRMGASLSIMNSKLVIAGGTNSSPGLLWGPGSLDSIETLDILVQEDGNGNAAIVRQASAPMASVTMLPISPFLEPVDNPPTAPPHIPVVHPEWDSDSEVPHRPAMQPTAPTLEEVEVHQVEQSNMPQAHAVVTYEGEEEWVPCDTDVSPMLPPPLPPALAPPATAAVVTVAVGDCGSADGDFSCAVCLERKKQVAFFCGHQACLHCSPLLTDCHICRKPIQGRIQLFGD